jgi:hypothetical protein
MVCNAALAAWSCTIIKAVKAEDEARYRSALCSR